jgi:hypothetical protein
MKSFLPIEHFPKPLIPAKTENKFMVKANWEMFRIFPKPLLLM